MLYSHRLLTGKEFNNNNHIYMHVCECVCVYGIEQACTSTGATYDDHDSDSYTYVAQHTRL